MLPDWAQYPLFLFGVWIIWRRAKRLAAVFGVGCLAWVGLSSARAYADHGDPYLAFLAGFEELVGQIQRLWN